MFSCREIRTLHTNAMKILISFRKLEEVKVCLINRSCCKTKVTLSYVFHADDIAKCTLEKSDVPFFFLQKVITPSCEGIAHRGVTDVASFAFVALSEIHNIYTLKSALLRDFR